MPFFIAAVAFLFAATFLYPGDAMVQVGGGHFWTVLWLLLLLVGLLGHARRFDGTKPALAADKNAPTGENAGKTGRKDESAGANARREHRKSGQRKSRKNVGENLRENVAKTEGTDRVEPTPPFRWGAADFLLALFLLVYLVLSPLGVEIEAARNAPSGFSGGGNFFVASNIFSAWITAACAWFLFRQILIDRRTAGLFLMILLALGLTEFFTALWQNHVVLPRQVAAYWADPEAALRQAGLDFTPDSTEGRLLVSRLETATPTGSYILANTLGGQLVTVGIAALLPLLFLLFSVRKPVVMPGNTPEIPPRNSAKNPRENSVRHSSRRFSPRPLLLASTALFATIFYALYLTRCRGAFVALAVGLAIFLVDVFVRQERFRFRRFGIATACLVLLGIGFALSPPGQTLLQGAKRSLGFRFEYWASTAEMVAEHPWTGCGIGNFQQAYLRHKKPTASEEILDPHNFVMELAGCGGLFSVGLFLLFLGTVFWRPWKSRPPKPASFPTRPLLTPGKEPFVYWTALAGCLVVTLLSRAEGGDLPVESFAAAPAAFVAVWFLRKIICGVFPFLQCPAGDANPTPFFATLPAVCFGAPLLGLLVHLLAAGGISYVNVLVLLMFFAAAMLTAAETASPTIPQETSLSPDFSHELSRAGTICLISLCVVLLLGVLVGLYLPGIRARTALDAASSPLAGSAERLRLLEHGAQRQLFLSHGYERALLDARFQAWLGRPDRRNRELLETEIERIAASAGRAPLLLLSLASALERVDAIAPDPEKRGTILRYYARACELYPNHAKVRAPYALALWKYGHKDEALNQRDEALRLDDVMPHLEQRLSSTLRDELENLN